MTTKMVARAGVSSLSRGAANASAFLRASQHGALLASENEPPYAEFARTRRLYAANTGAGTEVAPVAALPTTTATWALYNPASNTKVLVPLQINCWSVSGTLGLGMAMLAGLPPSVVASAPSAYTDSVNHAIMPGSDSSSAVFAGGVTIVAPTWNVHAARSQVAGDYVGSGMEAFVDGLYLIEPGYCLAGAVLAPPGGSADAAFGFGFIWGELDLDIG